MKKATRLPHEEASDQTDGLPADTDVEAHEMKPVPPDFAPRLPGTGGDEFRRPRGGGEIDDSDVEGHGWDEPEGFARRLPGTGGDRLRRPIGGGELGDDVEGHS